jgi:xanthine/uracil permease
MFILNYFDLTIVQLVSVIIVAILCGLGKSGLSGLIMLAIPILASTLGARQSTGVLLLFFIIGDIFAVKEYRKHADWKRIKRLLPPAAIGIILGGITGGLINDYQFKIAISTIQRSRFQSTSQPCFNLYNRSREWVYLDGRQRRRANFFCLSAGNRNY